MKESTTGWRTNCWQQLRLESMPNFGLEATLRSALQYLTFECVCYKYFCPLKERHSEGSPGNWMWEHMNTTIDWFDWPVVICSCWWSLIAWYALGLPGCRSTGLWYHLLLKRKVWVGTLQFSYISSYWKWRMQRLQSCEIKSYFCKFQTSW